MDRDINYYYEKYRESIKRVEANPKDSGSLADVSNTFTQLFDLIKMFTIMKKERYYGYFLMNMDMQVDYRIGYPAGVNIDTNPFRLKINPLQMSPYSIKEMIFIICHEIEHLVLSHPAEGNRLNKEKDPRKRMLLNIAMDASINDRLVKEARNKKLGMMECPADAITSKVLGEIICRPLIPLREFTYYYQSIPKDLVTLVEVGRLDSHEWTENDSPEDIEAAVKLFVEDSIRNLSEEEISKLPEHQRELIRKLMEPPKIKWQNVLKKYVGILPDGYRKTKSRLNRRQPERYDVSGRAHSRTIKMVSLSSESHTAYCRMKSMITWSVMASQAS